MAVGVLCDSRVVKVTVTPDRTISGSYDWLLLGQRATDRQCLLRSPASVAYGIDFYAWSRYHERLQNIDGKSHFSKSCDQWYRSTIDIRSVIAIDDRSYDQSWQPIVRSIVTAGDRWYNQSLHPATDPTNNRGILHVNDRTSTRGIL